MLCCCCVAQAREDPAHRGHTPLPDAGPIHAPRRSCHPPPTLTSHFTEQVEVAWRMPNPCPLPRTPRSCQSWRLPGGGSSSLCPLRITPQCSSQSDLQRCQPGQVSSVQSPHGPHLSRAASSFHLVSAGLPPASIPLPPASIPCMALSFCLPSSLLETDLAIVSTWRRVSQGQTFVHLCAWCLDSGVLDSI